MERHGFRKMGVLLVVSVLALTVVVQTANAALTLEDIKTWYWTGNTYILSVDRGDVDSDGSVEIVTGGTYHDDIRSVAQLCVWNGATMALENVKAWYWIGSTFIESVAVGDVDADGSLEIVTGGRYYDGTRWVAQLCIWNGATMALENVKVWYWTSDTYIESVAVSNVDADGDVEIVTGGRYFDGTRSVAQLCVWNGATLALESVKAWYWTSYTYTRSVAVGDVDADGDVEIVTGGDYNDGTRSVAQLCVWNGATLALENVKAWYWTSHTLIGSVAVGNVDGDAQTEIVTGGTYDDGTRDVAQLCVWNGASLTLENLQGWYWTSDTYIRSVAVGNADGDAQTEIVTGGNYYEGFRSVAQLCVWNGATMALENGMAWYWTSTTYIESVAVGDVDADGNMEIVTGGEHYDDTRYVAQLCVWT